MDPSARETGDDRGEAIHASASTPPQPQTAPAGTHDGVPQPSQQQSDTHAAHRTTQTAPQSVEPTFFGQIAGTDGPHQYESLRLRVTRAYKTHTYQYWFVAILSNSLLFLQIVIAASLTALGAFNNRRARTATIFLGASNTVIAGLLTYFKSRNQPNRARQFRNDLAAVVVQLDDTEANFRNPTWQGDESAELQKIRDAYKQARLDAQANYPDLWVKGTSPYNPNYTPPIQTDPKRGVSGLPSQLHRHRVQNWSPPGPSAPHRSRTG
ncbi:hypothetical protein CLCR_02588 [Cladophialophora carrionii]|uniref:SMODS and SLOG-associating 2TM effector domain-containing protein n=1 Tax=Cladophialophora carrionii TaxID=86049 RepID=A0A1C1CFT2_9EURO|nr:hypothetical protein CLCR_02588 [Cladophialophora carrionii]